MRKILMILSCAGMLLLAANLVTLPAQAHPHVAPQGACLFATKATTGPRYLYGNYYTAAVVEKLAGTFPNCVETGIFYASATIQLGAGNVAYGTLEAEILKNSNQIDHRDLYVHCTGCTQTVATSFQQYSSGDCAVAELTWPTEKPQFHFGTSSYCWN